MKTIDMRFDKQLIRSMIGQLFLKYRCDQFVYTNSVTQIVGLFIGNVVYKLTNIQEPVDYYGTDDDIAVYKIEKADESQIKSAFIGTDQINTPVGGSIEAIILVNENQKVYQGKEQLYDVWLTRGIVFKVNGREISFEKPIVPFSEEINIKRGYDLIKDYGDVNEFSKGWPEGISAEAIREVITIK